MERKNWHFCSKEDDTISLHDCLIDHVEWTEAGIWLFFEDGFNVTKDNSLNHTGRHQLSGKAAVFLKDGAYLEGFWNRGCTFQGPDNPEPVPLPEVLIQKEQLADLSLEVLDFTWETEKKRFYLAAMDETGYCDINFACTEVWFCWNELLKDAWFQDWS